MAERTALLAYAGATPFVAGTAFAVTATAAPVIGDPAPAVAAWALTIASFMAGVHWGQYLAGAEPINIDLFLTSNAIAIAGWLAFLLLPVSYALLVFALLFAILLAIDARLRAGAHIDPTYWRTRLGVTAIVIAALIVTAVFA